MFYLSGARRALSTRMGTASSPTRIVTTPTQMQLHTMVMGMDPLNVTWTVMTQTH